MKHAEESIRNLKQSVADMWVLVESQLAKSQRALIDYDRSTALEVMSFEKKVDAFELSIDRECERFFALLTPVASDMRLIISILKINNDLERIGDFAADIAEYVLRDQTEVLDPKLVERLRLNEMFTEAQSMLGLCKQILISENTTQVATLLAMDNVLDDINHDSVRVLADAMREHPQQAEQMLHLHTIVRRLERIGDRCSNIAEEIMFFVDAKVLKHASVES